VRYKIIILLILVVVGTLCISTIYAKDRDLIDSYNEADNKSKIENNPWNDSIIEVYEAMLKSEPVEIDVIPKIKQSIDYQQELIKHFDLPTVDTVRKMVDDPSCIDPDVLGDYRVFIFISKSVPEKTLKTYMRDALKTDETLLVIRGVIGSADFLKPTQDFITTLACGKKLSELKTDDKCGVSRVDINPLLFSLFKIGRVPAIVFSKLSYHELMIRSNLGQPIKDDEYFIIKGDISLQYALTKINEVAKNSRINNILTNLRGKYGG